MSDNAAVVPPDDAQALADRVFSNPAVIEAIIRLEEERIVKPDRSAMSREDFLVAFRLP